MKGLFDGICVVLENVALNIEALCNLYTACEEVLPDPEKLIDWILETAKPTEAIAFHVHTGKKRSNIVVRKLFGEKFVSKALEFLDDKCDEDLFTKVLCHRYGKDVLSEDHYDKMVEGLRAMKRLGYKREIHLFEGVLKRVSNKEIFREMVEEHPHRAAKPMIYQRLLCFDPYDLDFIRYVGMEAKSKGIRLEVTGIFCDGQDMNWKQVLTLLLDIGAKPSEAFQVSLKVMGKFQTESQTEQEVKLFLETAVQAKAAVDPTSKLIELGHRFVEGSQQFLADAMQKRLILLNDETLEDAWFRGKSEVVRSLFKLATESSSQALPGTLQRQLRCGNYQVQAVHLYFGAFCNLPDPDKQTCKLMIQWLKQFGMVSEAAYLESRFIKKCKVTKY